MFIRERLMDKLEETGAVVVEGPKWCGKTTTASQFAKSIIYLDDPALGKQYAEMLEMEPTMLLRGEKPRLFDEWQIAPKLWDTIRHSIDRENKEGLYILTGSAVPPSMDDIKHTGAGRYSWLTMSTMSLWESGDSTGNISLRDLFKGECQSGENKIDLQRMAYLICRGGWPGALDRNERASLKMVYNYYDAVVRSDVSRAEESARDAELCRSILRAYARMQGTQTPDTAILKDISAGDQPRVSINTLRVYLHAFEKIFMIEDMRAWNPNLRSKTAVRTSPTRYFSDPSIAVAALGIGPYDLMNDLETFGLIFETCAIRDLRVYARSMDGDVYHYRDKTGLECDAVVHLRNGNYGLVEIKLGGEKAIEYGVSTLKTLEEKIDTTKMPAPSFLMVLTAVGPYAYQRKDGVWVVPLGALKD
ncbi:MAG: DUF4143 domain-containing protein [Muribaculaceae bacterium]|nr:DUF4143 domain-containing protein [Muribaculaceae bacterium]